MNLFAALAVAGINRRLSGKMLQTSDTEEKKPEPEVNNSRQARRYRERQAKKQNKS